jgi:hypothetical protein
VSTWALVLFLYSVHDHRAGPDQPTMDTPVIIPGFVSHAACSEAADSIRSSQRRTGPHACVENRPARCEPVKP